MNPLDILSALAGGGVAPALGGLVNGEEGSMVGSILQGLAGGGLLPALLKHRDQIPPELLGILGGGGLLAGRAF